MHIKLKDFTIQSNWWNLYGFSIVFTVTSPLIIKNHQHHSILLALSIQYFDIIPQLSSHSRINLTQNNTNEQISKQESRKQKYEDAKEKRPIFAEEKRRGGGGVKSLLNQMVSLSMSSRVSSAWKNLSWLPGIA